MYLTYMSTSVVWQYLISPSSSSAIRLTLPRSGSRWVIRRDDISVAAEASGTSTDTSTCRHSSDRRGQCVQIEPTVTHMYLRTGTINLCSVTKRRTGGKMSDLTNIRQQSCSKGHVVVVVVGAGPSRGVSWDPGVARLVEDSGQSSTEHLSREPPEGVLGPCGHERETRRA